MKNVQPVRGTHDLLPDVRQIHLKLEHIARNTASLYGFQDIVDDEVIGLKSTSIKFKHNPKLFLSICYFLVIICFLVSGFILNLNKFYFMGLIFLSLHLFYFQILRLNRFNSDACLQIFKSNNTFGIIALITILAGKI